MLKNSPANARSYQCFSIKSLRRFEWNDFFFLCRTFPHFAGHLSIAGSCRLHARCAPESRYNPKPFAHIFKSSARLWWEGGGGGEGQS